MFLRSHNNIAHDLRRTAHKKNDNKHFRLARYINEAIYKKIIFEEWAPIVLGTTVAQQLNAETYTPSFSGKRAISNEFATAGIRFYFSMMPGDLILTRNNENIVSHKSNVITKSR